MSNEPFLRKQENKSLDSVAERSPLRTVCLCISICMRRGRLLSWFLRFEYYFYRVCIDLIGYTPKFGIAE